MISQDKALSILQPYFKDIINMHINAFNTFMKSSDNLQLFSNSTQASMIHDLIVNEAKQKFSGSQNVKLLTYQRLDLAIFDKCLRARFKKLNKDLTASNHPTNQVKHFNSQESLICGQLYLPGIVQDEFSVNDNFANINIGYRPNEIGTYVQGIYITCPMNNNTNRWEHQIYAHNVTDIFTEIIGTEYDPSEEKTYKIRIKNNSKEGKTDEQQG